MTETDPVSDRLDEDELRIYTDLSLNEAVEDVRLQTDGVNPTLFTVIIAREKPNTSPISDYLHSPSMKLLSAGVYKGRLFVKLLHERRC